MISSPEPLNAEHDLSAFSCGKPSLAHWLCKHARSNQQRGFTAVMVVHEAMRVIGYYGLAPTSVVPDILPRNVRTGQPPNPVPCLLLGKLAVDQAHAGRGIGFGLLKHALTRCVQVSQLIACRALLATAVDLEASDFWRRRGFLPLRVFRRASGAHLTR